MTTTKRIIANLISLSLLIPAKAPVYSLIDDIPKKQLTNLYNGLNLKKARAISNIAKSISDKFTGLETFKELQYKEEIYDLSQTFSKVYQKDLTNCKITKKQEGKMWCWVACLQGLMKHHGIEKKQKEIFNDISISKSIPAQQHNRNNGLSIYSSEKNMQKSKNKKIKSTIFPYMIKNYIEKISNEKLTYQMVYINPDSNEEKIKKSILDVYTKIGKKPFSMLANHTSSGHFINVFKIDDDGTMYIEDPAFEKGRKESIDDYVKNFDKKIKNMVNQANGIPLGFITEKKNSIKNPKDNSYKTADSIE